MKHENETSQLIPNNVLMADISITRLEMNAYQHLIRGHDFLSKNKSYHPSSRNRHRQQRDFYTRNLQQRVTLLRTLVALANERGILKLKGGDLRMPEPEDPEADDNNGNDDNAGNTTLIDLPEPLLGNIIDVTEKED